MFQCTALLIYLHINITYIYIHMYIMERIQYTIYVCDMCCSSQFAKAIQQPIDAHTEGSDSGDSEADRIKEERRKRFAQPLRLDLESLCCDCSHLSVDQISATDALIMLNFGFATAIPAFRHPNRLRKSSKSWGSVEKAGENVKARAREAVGYPENPEDPDLSWHFIPPVSLMFSCHWIMYHYTCSLFCMSPTLHLFAQILSLWLAGLDFVIENPESNWHSFFPSLGEIGNGFR